MVVATCGENGDSVSLCVRLPVLNKSNKLDVNIHHLSGSCPPSLSTWGWGWARAHSVAGDPHSSPSLPSFPSSIHLPRVAALLASQTWSVFPCWVRCGGAAVLPARVEGWGAAPAIPVHSLGGRAPGQGLPLTGQASQPRGLSPAFLPSPPTPPLSWLVRFSEWVGAPSHELTLGAPAVVSLSKT